jgi:hypothetical protein
MLKSENQIEIREENIRSCVEPAIQGSFCARLSDASGLIAVA